MMPKSPSLPFLLAALQILNSPNQTPRLCEPIPCKQATSNKWIYNLLVLFLWLIPDECRLCRILLHGPTVIYWTNPPLLDIGLDCLVVTLAPSPVSGWNDASQYVVSCVFPGWGLLMGETHAKFGRKKEKGSHCCWEGMPVRHSGSVTRHGSFNGHQSFADHPVNSHPMDALWWPDACSSSDFPTSSSPPAAPGFRQKWLPMVSPMLQHSLSRTSLSLLLPDLHKPQLLC